MNSDKIKAQQVKSALKSAEHVVVALRGYTLDDEEFAALSEHMTMIMKTLYAQRSNKSRSTQKRFNEAMKWLQTIRNTQ